MKSTPETNDLNPNPVKDQKPLKAVIVILGVLLVSGGVGYAVGRLIHHFI